MTKKSISRLLQASLMCCLAVLFTACDDILASEDNPTPAYLSMSEAPVTLKAGDTYKRQAISVTTAVVEYTSSDTNVATVDNEGVVTAIAKGETTITATATGYSTGGKKIFLTESKSYKLKVTPKGLATITTAPTATPGSIVAGSATALVTEGAIDGGKMMYQVTETNTKPTNTDGFSAEIPTAAECANGTYYVWYYAQGDGAHGDSEIAASAVEVTIVPPLTTPLTLEAITAGTIVVSKPRSGMQYTLNGGAKTAVPDGTPIDVAVGDKVAFYGSGTSISKYNISGSDYTKIGGGTADVKVYGNIMSLVDETGFATNTELTAGGTFKALFDNNDKLTDASGLLLPATALANSCYYNMFRYCTNLTTAPALPATALANSCYKNMFQDCSSLTAAPAELPAMTLASNCYDQMFKGCSALTVTPKLPATTLATACYRYMFQNCSSLTTAYVKAGYDGTNCKDMFKSCPNLSTCTLYTDGDWSSYTAISNWQKTAYPTE